MVSFIKLTVVLRWQSYFNSVHEFSMANIISFFSLSFWYGNLLASIHASVKAFILNFELNLSRISNKVIFLFLLPLITRIAPFSKINLTFVFRKSTRHCVDSNEIRNAIGSHVYEALLASVLRLRTTWRHISICDWCTCASSFLDQFEGMFYSKKK